VASMHVYEVRPRKDKRGVDLISDALPFVRLWYDELNAASNTIGYAKFWSRSDGAMTPLAHRSASYFLGCRRGLVIARVLRLPRFGSLASLIFGWDGTTRTGQDACRTTCSAMLPVDTCFKPLSPCVDVMIRLTSLFAANEQISRTGLPIVIAV